MKRFLAAGALVALLGLVGGVALAHAGSNITSPETIKIIGAPTSFAFVDADDSADFSPGDYIVFSEDLVSRDGTTQVGLLDVSCLFINFSEDICHGSANLTGRGQIAFEVQEIQSDAAARSASRFALTPDAGSNPRAFDVAITGGTGEFDNVRGYITVIPGRDQDRFTIHAIP
jgi:hypothetical protein